MILVDLAPIVIYLITPERYTRETYIFKNISLGGERLYKRRRDDAARGGHRLSRPTGGCGRRWPRVGGAGARSRAGIGGADAMPGRSSAAGRERAGTPASRLRGCRGWRWLQLVAAAAQDFLPAAGAIVFDRKRNGRDGSGKAQWGEGAVTTIDSGPMRLLPPRRSFNGTTKPASLLGTLSSTSLRPFPNTMRSFPGAPGQKLSVGTTTTRLMPS